MRRFRTTFIPALSPHRGSFLKGVALCLVGSLLIAWKTWDDRRLVRRFEAEGLATTAIVVSREEGFRDNGDPIHYLTVEHSRTEDIAAFRHRAWVPKSYWQEHRDGDVVQLRYLPDLRKAWIPGQDPETEDPVLIILFVLACGSVFAWLYRATSPDRTN